MTPEDRFNEHYKKGSAPWDIGKPDFNLIQTGTTTPIVPCTALEIGCGTGDNAIWLSEQKFEVIGVDTSEIAIEKARTKAAEANVQCTFAVLDILKGHVDGAPFGFLFDRGCFHTMDSSEQRQSFAKQVQDHQRGDDLSLNALLEQLAARVAQRVLDGLSGSAFTHDARLLSVERAADYIGRTVPAVQQMISAGKLPTVRVDRRVFLDKRDLDLLIDKHKEAGIE